MARYASPITTFKWLYLPILFFCCHSRAYAQLPVTDTAGKAYTAALMLSYPLENEAFLKKLKEETPDKALYVYYRSKYKDIHKGVNEIIKDGKVIYNPDVSASLEAMLAEIKAKNPSVPRDIKVWLIRSETPNAYTLGDGNIFVNLGLFYHLQNEDQVAGVLAHELAHLMLKHSLAAMKYNYEQDRASVADVKQIKQVQEKKADRAFELLKNTVYQEGKNNRAHEMQADSLGYELIRNTRYAKADFPDALNIITSSDTLRPEGLRSDIYKRLFDLPLQKFKESWLKQEDFSSYTYSGYKEKFDKDSILSHPVTQERIKRLQTLFPELVQAQKTGKQAPGQVNKAFTTAKEQRMNSLFLEEEYGIIIYRSLLQLQQRPDDKEYKEWLGKGFRKIYEARKSYQLNRHLDRISPKDQSESYIQFLSFMWNLKLEEIKNIADFYDYYKG